MALASNILRRAGKYQYRIRVPRSLVARFGRTELKRSLKTADPAVAKRRALVAGRMAHGLFDWVRQDAMLTRQDIEAATRAFYALQLEEDRLTRVRSSRLSVMPQPRRDIADTRRQLAALDFSGIGPVVTAWAAANGQDCAPDSREHELLCEYFLRARFEADSRAAEADRGICYGEPRDPLFTGYDPVTRTFAGATFGRSAPPLPTREAAPPGEPPPIMSAVTGNVARHVTSKKLLTITQMAEKAIAEYDIDRVVPRNPDGTPGQCRKTQAPDYRRTARAFEEIIGPKPICEITPDDVVAFKDALLETPKHTSQETAGDMLAAIEANRARRGNGEAPLPTISPTRINSGYLSPLRAIFDYAQANAAVTVNPALNVRVGGRKAERRRKQDKRHPFSSGEQNRILAAPLYTGCVSDRYWHDKVFPRTKVAPEALVYPRTYRFWTPLIMLLMGCRPEEVGQLRVVDLAYVSDWPCLVVANNPERNEEPEQREIMDIRGKTDAARRTLPIHPILVALGLLDRIEACRRAGETRIFPEWKVTESGIYSDRISKEFNAEGRFLNRVGVKTDKKVLYSLRHSFKDALRDIGFEERAQDYLMGHTNNDVSELYGSSELRAVMVDRYLAGRWCPEVDFRGILDGPDDPAIKIERIPPELRTKLTGLGVECVGGVPLLPHGRSDHSEAVLMADGDEAPETRAAA